MKDVWSGGHGATAAEELATAAEEHAKAAEEGATAPSEAGGPQSYWRVVSGLAVAALGTLIMLAVVTSGAPIALLGLGVPLFTGGVLFVLNQTTKGS
jgi:hypothetical protein